MKAGYYWNAGKPESPFVGRWQWRCEHAAGGAGTKEEAISDLKLAGATSVSDTTAEGGGGEFAHSESA